jgi:hypothetical protein
MIPQNYSNLEGADAKAMLKLYDAIDDKATCRKFTPISTLTNRKWNRF